MGGHQRSNQDATNKPLAPAELGKLLPQFSQIALLGVGGMGTIYKAIHRKLKRKVAIKVLHDSGDTIDNPYERFEREAEALAALDHPNVVRVYDYGIVGGLHYIVMEYIDGVSLREAFRNTPNGRVKAEQALRVVSKVCAGLAAAHSKGLVHRDVKPENVMISRAGKVKIIDFGIAKRLSRKSSQMTKTGWARGTQIYAAPEQFEDPEHVDHRADIYAVRVVLYEMLTGQLPVGNFEPPSTLAGVSSELDEIVSKALQRRKEQRYASAEEMDTAVRQVTKPIAITLTCIFCKREVKVDRSMEGQTVNCPHCGQVLNVSVGTPEPSTLEVPRKKRLKSYRVLNVALILVCVCAAVMLALVLRKSGPDPEMAARIPTETIPEEGDPPEEARIDGEEAEEIPSKEQPTEPPPVEEMGKQGATVQDKQPSDESPLILPKLETGNRVVWEIADDGNGHAYEAVQKRANWFEARDAAKEAGGYLASITSREENEFVFGLIDSPEFWTGYDGNTHSWGPWLGGLQAIGAPEPDRGWTWCSNEKFSYSKWFHNEPSNDGGRENYILFFTMPGKKRAPTWNDEVGNDKKRGYIIEYEADSPVLEHQMEDSSPAVEELAIESDKTEIKGENDSSDDPIEEKVSDHKHFYDNPRAVDRTIRRGLVWVTKQQQRDGSWSLKLSTLPSDNVPEDRAAATSLALLTLQGNGHDGHGNSSLDRAVARGHFALLCMRHEEEEEQNHLLNKSIYGGDNIHVAYSKVLMDLAICDLRAMVDTYPKRTIKLLKDEGLSITLQEASNKSVTRVTDTQSPDLTKGGLTYDNLGGWGYSGRSDASVTGWHVQVLYTARSAGLRVPGRSIRGAQQYLQSLWREQGELNRYIYAKKDFPNLYVKFGKTTFALGSHASAITSLRLLGQTPQPESLDVLIRQREHAFPMPYFGYYGTHALVRSQRWKDWWPSLEYAITKSQVISQGDGTNGSWTPSQPSGFIDKNGRLCLTCFRLLTLEVPKRLARDSQHFPQVGVEDHEEKPELISGSKPRSSPRLAQEPDHNAAEWPKKTGGNGHFYEPVVARLGISWDQAQKEAQAAGGYLVTITSKEENVFVFDLIDDPAYWYPGENLRGPWIGGRQLPGSEEPAEGWTWVTGEPFGYTNWDAQQPNDLGKLQEDRIHFGIRPGRTNTWGDVINEHAEIKAYLIEYDTEPRSSNLKRVHWLKSGGLDFVRLSDGTWREQGDNGKTYFFREGERSESFIELIGRTEPQVSYRLFKNRALIKRGNGTFSKKYVGRWSYDSRD